MGRRRRGGKRTKEAREQAARSEDAARQRTQATTGDGGLAVADVETMHVERAGDARLFQRAVNSLWKCPEAMLEVVPRQMLGDVENAEKPEQRQGAAKVLLSCVRQNLEAEKLASPAASTNVNVQVNTNVLNSLSELSDEQLERLIAEGRAAGAGPSNGDSGPHAGGDHAGNGNGTGTVATNGTGKHD